MSGVATRPDCLLGRHDLAGVLRAVRLEQDGQQLVIEYRTGRVLRFGVAGDCCSRSWIEHLESIPDVDGATVLSVEEAGGDTKPGEDLRKFDSLAVYETRIHTDRGTITMEYRNDSNGYYGGFLVFEGEDLATPEHGGGR